MEYDETLKLDPNFAMGYYNRAITYQMAGNTQAAIDQYDEALRHNPDNDVAYRARYWCATLLEQQNRISEARQKLEEAVRINTAAHVDSNHYALKELAKLPR